MTTLRGGLVALSVSDAPDRAKLGFPSREIDRALFSICTALVRTGAKIVYGGNLDPNGLTFGMFRHLAGAYAASREAPFIHVIPEPIFRETSFEGLSSALREGVAVVETWAHLKNDLYRLRAVDDGLRIGEGSSRQRITNSVQFESWLDAIEVVECTSAYSAARKAMTEMVDARVVLGGKMGLLDCPGDAYQGAMPGIIEETILTLEAGIPCFPLGAFGGAARDVAIALGLLDSSKHVPRGKQLPTYASSLKRVSELRDNIPLEVRPALIALADDDRGESMAYSLVEVLCYWLAEKRKIETPAGE